MPPLRARGGRPAKEVPIIEEDYELAVRAVATMIARWWDANGHQMPDTDSQDSDHLGNADR